jgi:long-chain acyl-CoA synthetase
MFTCHRVQNRDMEMVENRFYVDENSPWLQKSSGWPDEVPKNLELDERPLYQMLAESCHTFRDRRVIWFEPLDATMTYGELLDAVDRMAAGLHARGIARGDVVALMLPNSPQYIISFFACQKLGAIVTGVNPVYKPKEVLHQLKTTDAKAMIVLDIIFRDQVAPVYEESGIELLVVTNILDCIKGHVVQKFFGRLLGKVPMAKPPEDAVSFKLLLDATNRAPEVDIDCMDEAVYIMTGGTTGTSKAAVLSHLNCVNNAKQATHWIYNVSPGCAYVGILPLFHAFAMSTIMNTMLRSGGFAMLFPKPPAQDVLIEKIIEHGPKEGTIYCGAEILFKRMGDFLREPENNVKYQSALHGKLSLCISGASPLHRPVQELFEKMTGAKLSEGYGLTECSPVVSCAPFWGKRSVGTIGLPLPSTEWRIVDKGDPAKELGLGEENVGELIVAGPAVMKGYLNQPEETAEALREMDGKRWLLTGDIGYMDECGRVVLLDRKKQLIKVKGISVFPKEVEELVAKHEGVSEVAVAGLPDPTTGEVIKAWVVLTEAYRDKITEEELMSWCFDNMSRHKVPRLIEFRESIPKNIIGKVLRRELQENDPIWINWRASATLTRPLP